MSKHSDKRKNVKRNAGNNKNITAESKKSRKKKKMKITNPKRFTIFLIIVILIIFMIVSGIMDGKGNESNDKENKRPAAEETYKGESNRKVTGGLQENGEYKATYVDNILVVNKQHPIPADFAEGENPEAAKNIKKMISDMQSEGLDISDRYSGYRSHKYQTDLYNNYVAKEGREAADTYSARPGFSEHETGLSFDLINNSGELVTSEAEAEWIKTNAHRYGFIVRYPEGREDITGYMPEPWHLRYIGKEAGKIYESGLTLEEYLDIEGGNEYVEVK